VAYTPGHASHHVCYLHEPTRRLFSGDVAGVRIGEGPVLAPTPPPDIDLCAWRASLELIEGLRPRSIAVTHFGAYEDVDGHLLALRAQLELLEAMARELDEESFARAIRELVAGVAGAEAGAYEQATPPSLGFAGLRRYLRAAPGEVRSVRGR
jgi:glyoxylase-like metal-dependent hydrolase (beta-lactamase superfamily II)